MGEYRLLSRIGEGGMGVVHLAQKPGGARVALKVLRPHVVGDDEARARLAREVNSLSRIRSRRVAEIVDADPWADVPYVATRYVPGLSLHDHVKDEGPIEGEDLTRFALELAAALDAVHRVGVLHRDVKPSNVLMEGRNPILIDFGLARVADDPRLTHTGWLLGTPGYLAPEILYGEDATTASDLHALASTIAYAGLGRAPFGRGPAMAVMDRVRRGQHDLDGLPDHLRGVLERALDPDPVRRPTLVELRGWLDPDSYGQATRTRPAVGAAAGAAAVGLGAAGGAGAAAAGLGAVDADAATTVLPPVVDEPPPGSTKVLPAEAPAPTPVPAPDPAPAHGRGVTLPGAPPVAPQMPPQHAPYRQPPPPPPAAYPPPQQSRPQGYPPERAQGHAPAPGQQGGPPPGYGPPGAPRRQRSAAVRFRSGLLVLGLAAVVATCAAVAPWVTLAVVSVVVWVLRALSLGATARRRRAERRGAHWSDGPLAVLAGPWHLLVALGGTFALLLWAVILALSAGLLALALGAGELLVLAAAGAVLALAVWTGPGSSRVRGPMLVVADVVSANAVVWLLFLALVAAIAASVALAADSAGASWLPAAEPPSAPSDPGALWREWVDRIAFWA